MRLLDIVIVDEGCGSGIKLQKSTIVVDEVVVLNDENFCQSGGIGFHRSVKRFHVALVAEVLAPQRVG